ncbi:hypothetical protein CCUS01_16314 [Colletotrichum cuscutae]|uniref:Uncharacterized protein n=1 Tax=Colletotrichum cuscutae TaxID=1209917 RepID=A0AAI9Y5Q7_9PEZI|nr:hypothetical protein CCUS01_16314 [Colletotrichum cuscutae]
MARSWWCLCSKAHAKTQPRHRAAKSSNLSSWKWKNMERLARRERGETALDKRRYASAVSAVSGLPGDEPNCPGDDVVYIVRITQ